MKQNDLLNPGCQVIIPAHRDAVKVLYGSDSRFEKLQKSINKHFKLSYLMDNTNDLHLNPLWEATQGKNSMKGYTDRYDFQLNITENLYRNFIKKDDIEYLNDKGKLLFGDRNKPRPTFIVLTAM